MINIKFKSKINLYNVIYICYIIIHFNEILLNNTTYIILVNTLNQVYKISRNNTHLFSVVHSQRLEIDKISDLYNIKTRDPGFKSAKC